MCKLCMRIVHVRALQCGITYCSWWETLEIISTELLQIYCITQWKSYIIHRQTTICMPRNLMDKSQNKNSENEFKRNSNGERAADTTYEISGVPLPIQLRVSKSQCDQSWLVRWHEPIINGRRTHPLNHYSSFLQVKVTSVLSKSFLKLFNKKTTTTTTQNKKGKKDCFRGMSSTSKNFLWLIVSDVSVRRAAITQNTQHRNPSLVQLWDMIKWRWKCSYPDRVPTISVLGPCKKICCRLLRLFMSSSPSPEDYNSNLFVNFVLLLQTETLMLW